MVVAGGIDIGGTHTVFGWVNKQGKILYKGVVKTKQFKTPEALVLEVSDHLKEALISINASPLGIGIGAPNGNYYTGTIEFAPNLIWQGIIPMVRLFERQMDLPCKLTNDANAAALGEMIFGGAKGMQDFIFMTLGTGVGSGIVANGHLIYGHDGFAGELGHVIVQHNGRKCGCTRNGCLETYCSASGIAQTYMELSGLTQLLTSKEVFDRAGEGDKIAIETFTKTGEILGMALANSVAYTSPEAIFLFGGPTQAGDLLLKPTVNSFEANLLKIYQNKIPIKLSELPQQHAPVLGAASLCWE